MMLTCLQKNDAFTVNDTFKGNGALTYGIGLITADEVVLGGGWSLLDLSLKNYHYYLYTVQVEIIRFFPLNISTTVLWRI